MAILSTFWNIRKYYITKISYISNLYITNMEISILTMYNDWWITGRPRKELIQPHHRLIFEKIMSFIDDRQIILLYGLRRVGKTTIMYQIIDKLLNQGISSEHILYFSFDENNATIDELLRIYSNEVLRTNLDKAGLSVCHQ